MGFIAQQQGNEYLTYQFLNRLVESVDALTGVSSQGFDADGNRDSITDPNSNETRFDFDKSGRLVQETLATADQVSYTYNARNLLASVTNRRGQQRQFEYDAGGRITRWTDPDGSVSYTYDANGNVLTVTDSNGTITREYDKLNRVTKYTDIQRNTLQYAYDEVGNLVALTYPDGRQVHYEYDAANQLIKVTDWAGRETHYEYDLNSRLINVLRPNGTQMTRVYDDAGQLLQQKEVIISSGELISQFDFAYNAAGDIRKEQIAPEPNLEVNPLEMTYAAANRLATYDGSAVQLDADGNMIFGPLSGGMANFAFDSRNRLVAAGNTAYRYDAENQRTAVSIDGQETRYVINSQSILSQVLVRTQPDGTQTYYVYGLGLIGQEKQGQYLSYHFDFRGSTVALTDETGQVTERFQYSPYGLLLSGDASITPFLFNGMYGVMTDSNGLYYMRARYYHPEIRRFVNQDVLLGIVVEGQTLNRYGFVTGKPINSIDPEGKWVVPVLVWGIGAALFLSDIFSPIEPDFSGSGALGEVWTIPGPFRAAKPIGKSCQTAMEQAKEIADDVVDVTKEFRRIKPGVKEKLTPDDLGMKGITTLKADILVSKEGVAEVFVQLVKGEFQGEGNFLVVLMDRLAEIARAGDASVLRMKSVPVNKGLRRILDRLITKPNRRFPGWKVKKEYGTYTIEIPLK